MSRHAANSIQTRRSLLPRTGYTRAHALLIAWAGELPTAATARAAASISKDSPETTVTALCLPSREDRRPGTPVPRGIDVCTRHSSSHICRGARPPRRRAASCCTRTTMDTDGVRSATAPLKRPESPARCARPVAGTPGPGGVPSPGSRRRRIRRVAA
ncbi:hypothetical protein ARZXY2_379 [Arthrobacter sp. ZXY-2]|nr:hypothetical protein ARZXY2_379 [Arthrobacter sp. ZXY-2]